jgi:phosphoribosylamine--glycine ligase
VPTGFFSSFTDPDEAVRYVHEVGAPIVVKADGLAAGKGVLLCATVAEAEEAIDRIMRWRMFGEAGARVIVEELLEGEEVSFMAVTDGRTVLPLASSQDHKRAFDADTGPNTGGMGAYSPAPACTPALHERIMSEIMIPVVRGLAERKIVYTGVLYAGLMITADGPKVLEFNVRFGDPECQALMMRFDGDLAALMSATVEAGSMPRRCAGIHAPPSASSWRPTAIRATTSGASRSAGSTRCAAGATAWCSMPGRRGGTARC